MAFPGASPYIAAMQRRSAFATTSATPDLPGAVGLRVQS
jgi:hypothetical protein